MKRIVSVILLICLCFSVFGNLTVFANTSSGEVGGIVSGGTSHRLTSEDVDSVETFPIEMIENTYGSWQPYTDEETGESGEYYCYNWSSFIGYRINLKNGDVIEAPSGYFDYEGVHYPLAFFHSHKSYEERWEVGNTYTEKIKVLGEEYDVEISIVESPVVSIRCEVEEIVIKQGTYCNVVTEGNTPLYHYRWYEAANWIAVFNDGKEYTTYNRILEIDGHNYNFEFIDGQATLENWTAGNTYGAKAKFLGAECDIQITITDSPIKEVSFGEIYVYENADGNWNHHWDSDIGEQIEYFRYNWSRFIPYTVTYFDGTTSSGIGNYLFYNDEYYGFETADTQLWNNEWQAGNTYSVQIGVAGEKYTAYVKVLPSPVKSVRISNIVIPQGLEGETYTEYDPLLNKEFTYFRYEPQGFIDYSVTFKDGTVKEGNRYGFTYDGRSYGASIVGGMQNHENIWIPGNTYYITIDVMGAETVVPVYIKPIPEAASFGYSIRYDNTVRIRECSKTDERLVIPKKFGDYTISEISSLEIAEEYINEICIPKSVDTLSMYDFSEAENLTKIYYEGTESEWRDISHHYRGYGDIQIIYNYSDPAWKETADCEHFYDNDCDSECNLCLEIRSVGAHKYDNKCDTDCNICGDKREITHSYKTVTTNATTSKNGKIVKSCVVCGKVASTKIIYYPKTVKLSATTYTYNGKIKKPTVTVKDSAGKTVSSSNYTVVYASGRKYVGKYKVTVKFKGNYTGTKTLYFTVNPPKTSVSKLTAYYKKLKVSITKKSSQVTGYQIQYSTSKTFKKNKTKTISNYKTNSAYLTGLASKKTYYVRVRTFKTVNGKKYYSSWSSYKYKKTK